MLIYLIGFMGSGKTSAGEKLAKKMGLGFADLDQLIEQKLKKNLSRIFEEKGEEFFREAEQKQLHATFKMTDTVIACGGGTPCYFDNMAQMKKHGKTVYIRLAAGSIFHRIAPVKEKRPLIADMPDLPLMEYIIRELDKRSFYYEQADIVVKGEDLNTEELAGILRIALKS